MNFVRTEYKTRPLEILGLVIEISTRTIEIQLFALFIVKDSIGKFFNFETHFICDLQH